jgi:rhodanese-related sulfurtransferase
MADTVERISPDEAYERVSMDDALLVCAYDDPNKFADNHLAGASSLDEFEARVGSLPRETEVIFYCA